MGLIDHSGEATSINFHFEAIEEDGGNWEELFAPLTGKYPLLKVAMVALTGCNHTRTTASVPVDTSTGSLPADEYAQRELAVRITYVDNVTAEKFRLDIPGPVSGLIPEGTDVIPLTNLLLAAFITAFEWACVSPRGNALTVIGARFVGRKS
jgi:hypothetical protein